ncbi:hypothetical protein ACVWZK_001718 [Bradyrhizobium sp. GM0.4]
MVGIPPDGRDCGGKHLKAAANGGKQPRSGIGERKRSRSAAKQSAATILLKQHDLMADRGWRHAEFCRGLLEAQMAGGSFKSAELDQGRQLVHAASLDETNSSSPEFFGFAPRGPPIEDIAG